MDKFWIGLWLSGMVLAWVVVDELFGPEIKRKRREMDKALEEGRFDDAEELAQGIVDQSRVNSVLVFMGPITTIIFFLLVIYTVLKNGMVGFADRWFGVFSTLRLARRRRRRVE